MYRIMWAVFSKLFTEDHKYPNGKDHIQKADEEISGFAWKTIWLGWEKGIWYVLW